MIKAKNLTLEMDVTEPLAEMLAKEGKTLSSIIREFLKKEYTKRLKNV